MELNSEREMRTRLYVGFRQWACGMTLGGRGQWRRLLLATRAADTGTRDYTPRVSHVE